MKEVEEAASIEHHPRRIALRLGGLALVLGMFLFLGERWLTTRALARAVARVEALGMRVGGPDFVDGPGKDAAPWIADVVAASGHGGGPLSLAAVPAEEGLRNSWATRLAGWDPGKGFPAVDVLALWRVTQQLGAAIDVDLAAGDLEQAAARLAALARIVVILQDGTLVEAMAAVAGAEALQARLVQLSAAHTAQADPASLADLAASVAEVRPAEALTASLRREGAFSLAVIEHAFGGALSAPPGGLENVGRTRALRAAYEHWADMGEALTEPDVDRRADAMQRIAADASQRAPEWLRALTTRDLSSELRHAASIQVSLDDFCARHGVRR